MSKRLWDYKRRSGLIDYYRLIQTSPNVLVFSLFNQKSNSASKIRHYFAKMFWKELPSYGTKNGFRIVKHFFVWPYYFYKSTKKLGHAPYAKVTKLTGKSKNRQLLEQFYLACFYSFSAKEYYINEFFKDANRKKAGKYILRLTFKPFIFIFLDEIYKKRHDLSSINSPDSKDYFHKMADKYHLPTIPVFAKVMDEGEVTYFTNKTEIINNGDLFIKPEEGNGGAGAELWRKDDEFYENSANNRFRFDELIEHIKGIKSKGFNNDFIIQPRILNHRDLDFDTKALNTIRIFSFLFEDEVIVPFAEFKFSLNKDSEIDNLHAGGHVAPVDMETGKLGSSTDMGYKDPGEWIDFHPVNGKPIKGLVLPFWEEIKELVIKGHKEAFNNRIMLGWDVAVSKNGPLIVETNGWPGFEGIPRIYKKATSELPGFSRYADEIELHYKEYYK